MRFQHRILVVLVFALLASPALAANPLSAWKKRLFGSAASAVEVVDAPVTGVVVLGLDRPQRLYIDERSPKRKFAKGKSRYREIELQRTFANVALRLQVISQRNAEGHGNTAFKPVILVLNDDDSVRETKEVEPMHLDIRPFKPSRLLGCVSLENVRRFAIATTPEAIGQAFTSAARTKVKAPTKGGFYYSTEPVSARLPYAENGEIVIEATQEKDKGAGC